MFLGLKLSTPSSIKLQHFIFDNYEKRRAKSFYISYNKLCLGFFQKYTSSACASEGFIFDKIQGIVL